VLKPQGFQRSECSTGRRVFFFRDGAQQTDMVGDVALHIIVKNKLHSLLQVLPEAR
jgi:hypothetical protein